MVEPVIFLPGVTGSSLWRTGPFGVPIPVWDVTLTLPGGIHDVAILSDGSDAAPTPVSPRAVIESPHSALDVACRPFLGFYGDLRRNMQRLGWSWYALPTDWRRSGSSQAVGLKNKIDALIGNSPFHLVTHSQGTRYGRALYQVYKDLNIESRILNVVELAPPVLGVWQSVAVLRGWGALPNVLSFIEQGLRLPPSPVLAIPLSIMVVGSQRETVVRALWSLPGVLDLLPFDGGDQPDDRREAAAEVWNADYWDGAAWATQERLDDAHARIANYAAVEIPRSKHWVLFSVGFPTVFRLRRTRAFGQRPKFNTYVNGQGDGQVSAFDLGTEDVQYWPVFGDHSSLVGGLYTSETVDVILRGLMPQEFSGGGGDVDVAGPQVPTGDMPQQLLAFMPGIDKGASAALAQVGNQLPIPIQVPVKAPSHCPDPVRDRVV